MQALLFSGPGSRVLARLASLAQTAELARSLSLARCTFSLPSFFINCLIAHFILLFLIFLPCVAGVERNFLCECNSVRIAQNILKTRGRWKDIYLMTLLLSNLLAELSRAKRASGAPWVRKFGKLSIRENLVMT